MLDYDEAKKMIEEEAYRELCAIISAGPMESNDNTIAHKKVSACHGVIALAKRLTGAVHAAKEQNDRELEEWRNRQKTDQEEQA